MSKRPGPAADAGSVSASAADSDSRTSAATKGAGPVSVVVCAYTLDRWDDLAAAVTSLQHQSRPPAEIIVVSDHNPLLFARVAATWPSVIALENEERRGLSGARNTGVRSAKGDIVAFLDDDATAEAEWLARLLAAYVDSTVLGVGGAILPKWDTSRPAWFPEEFDWVVGCTYKGMPTTRARQRNLIGANMSFRAELFAAAGDFQTDMGRIGVRPLGCEETELCIRGAQTLPGTRYLYEPLARVHHRVPASRTTWRYFVSRCYSEGLSKAQVSGRVGSDAGLASERQYATRTLPAGVLRGIQDALLGRKPGGLGRAAAIIAGLAITGMGYARGRLVGPRAAGVEAGTPERAASGKAPAEAS
jgi:glucosyl-dolichyl phosphate glucuronosyltransferase